MVQLMLDLRLVAAFGALALALAALVLALFCIFRLFSLQTTLFVVQKKTKDLQEFQAELEGEEDQARAEKSARMSELGRLGAQNREENKEMRQAAMNEGRETLAGPGTPAEKMGKLRGLIQKYPRVAEGVARSLNREFGISKQLGLSEDLLLQEVAKILQEKANPRGEAEAPAENLW